MLLIGCLIGLQLAVFAAGFVLIWRRMDAMRGDVEHLRRALEAHAELHVDARRKANAPAAAVEKLADWRRRLDREITAVRAPFRSPALIETPNFPPNVARAIVVVCALALPALGLAIGAPLAGIVTAGLAIAGAAALVSLRAAWRDTAWFATIGGGAWALTGLLAGVDAAPGVFCNGLVFAASAGLLRARLARPTMPGATLALAMAAGALAVGFQFGLIGPAGMAFGVIVALGAAFGAAALRLEWIHIVSFIAAGVGVFVLSGQRGADIWFTPAAVWAGVWFWALAFVRAPELGPRGILIATTGTIAPLFAVSALYQAGHGLETPLAASAGFFVLAASFTAILVLAARRQRRLADLHLTLWALGVAAFGALAVSAMLIAPPAAHATVLLAIAGGAVAIHRRWEDRFWSTAAVVFALTAVALAAGFVVSFNAPNAVASPLTVALFAVTAPALIAGLAAHFAKDRAPIAGAVLEAVALLGGAAALSAWTRLAFSNGAPALQGVSFVETGAHAALWLGAGLLLAARAARSAAPVRNTYAAILTGAGALVSFACLIAWITPWWGDALTTSALAPPLGFAAPAAAFWAHWAYWRHTEDAKRARWAFGAAGWFTAAAITLELVWQKGWGAAWAAPVIGAAAFAVAAGLNFVPGLAVKRAPIEHDDTTVIALPPKSSASRKKKNAARSVENTPH